ncbi:MFS transporter [Streptomyces sp. NPDC127039]|uniref:MFS transporter n=1 Tax=Streptomyces sp. NPDC127039 TaxID=3347115 RepID=UPI00365240D0
MTAGHESAGRETAGDEASGAGVTGHDDRAPVTGAWVTRFGLLYLGQNIAWAAPSQLLIAHQVAEWHPESKETYLAWLMAAGGVVSMVATPLAGVISDRTVSRFGRRSPWILAGALGAAAALVAMSVAGDYATLLVAWLLFQVTIAFAINATQTVPPDRVPQRQYGMVSGVMGLTYTFAVVAGTLVATVLPRTAAYLAAAVLLAVFTAQFLMGFREPPGHRGPDPVAMPAPQPARASPQGPMARVRHDYWWVFAARLLVTLAQAIALFYLLYFLRDRIEYPDPDSGVLLLTLVYAAAVLGTAVVGGRWSDRLRRRKPFIALTSYGLAVAAVTMAFAGSFGVVVVAAVVLGTSWGIYTAVDQALINEVLPDPDARGRDIGVMNLAVAAPNSLAPALAGLALTHLGGYPGLYLCAALLALVGGAVIRFVRTVD